MYTISHAFSGFLILRILIEISPEIYSKSMIFFMFSIIFSNLPDLDVFWSKTLNDHHVSFFHSPIFWSIISLVMIIILPRQRFLSILLIINVFFHLFTDYLTGRTAGIAIFFPFSTKEYSIFKLDKKDGNFSAFNIKESKRFFLKYFKNKTQVLIQGAILVAGIISIMI